MKKIITISIILLSAVGLLGCKDGNSLQTVEQMRKEACAGNVEGFFSYVDKETVAEDMRERTKQAMLKKNPDADESYHDQRMSMLESVIPGLMNQMWQRLISDIKKGESGPLCTMKIEKAQGDTVTIGLSYQEKPVVWGFGKSNGKLMLVSMFAGKGK